MKKVVYSNIHDQSRMEFLNEVHYKVDRKLLVKGNVHEIGCRLNFTLRKKGQDDWPETLDL